MKGHILVQWGIIVTFFSRITLSVSTKLSAKHSWLFVQKNQLIFAKKITHVTYCYELVFDAAFASCVNKLLDQFLPIWYVHIAAVGKGHKNFEFHDPIQMNLIFFGKRCKNICLEFLKIVFSTPKDRSDKLII